MTEPKVIRSEINREMTTIACECKNKMAKLRKPLITVKYKRNQLIYVPMVKLVNTLAPSTSAAMLHGSSPCRATKVGKPELARSKIPSWAATKCRKCGLKKEWCYSLLKYNRKSPMLDRSHFFLGKKIGSIFQWSQKGDWNKIHNTNLFSSEFHQSQ